MSTLTTAKTSSSHARPLRPSLVSRFWRSLRDALALVGEYAPFGL